MLRRYFELTAYVIADELSEKRVALIVHKIIEPYTRTDKYTLYLGERLDLFYKLYVFSMIRLQILTGRGREALTRRANAVLQLLFARGVAEIRGRTAYIVDIALKVGHFSYELGFSYDAFNAS